MGQMCDTCLDHAHYREVLTDRLSYLSCLCLSVCLSLFRLLQLGMCATFKIYGHCASLKARGRLTVFIPRARRKKSRWRIRYLCRTGSRTVSRSTVVYVNYYSFVRVLVEYHTYLPTGIVVLCALSYCITS